MPDPAATREAIVAAARALFAARGYDGTSLQDIATEAGCSKASLLYHFPGKGAIQRAIIEGPIAALNALVDRAAAAGGREGQSLLIDGFVDLILTYHDELRSFPHQLARLVELPEFADLRIEALGERMVPVLTGGSTDPADEIAAVMVVVGIAEASVVTADHPTDVVRAALRATARRSLGLRARR